MTLQGLSAVFAKEQPKSRFKAAEAKSLFDFILLISALVSPHGPFLAEAIWVADEKPIDTGIARNVKAVAPKGKVLGWTRVS